MKCRLLIFFLLLAGAVSGQTKSGFITDENTKLPMAGVTVYNRVSKSMSASEVNGAYAIKAAPGDTVIFIMHGYATEKRAVTGNDSWSNITMSPAMHQLDEVIIESPYRKYSEDSASERAIYHKTINDAAQHAKLESVSPGAGTFGVNIGGLFTSLANRVSGRTKKYRRFVHGMQSDEQSRYISIVYNPDKVIALTHATDSMAEQFIVHTPMPYDFARTASSLEISMWIREHYREFTAPKPAVSTRSLAQ